MSNLFDYINEFGSISFDEEMPNDVDNIIFCRLVYLDFSAHIGKTIEKIAQELEENKGTLTKKGERHTRSTYKLLFELAGSERFKGVKIRNFHLEEDDDRKFSFCAAIFTLNKRLDFVAFRGTDDSVASISEDIAMSCEFPVTSQIKALQYINIHYINSKRSLYLAGHSKGGNLALFAFICANESIKEKIIRVYNNDGPGFPDSFMDGEIPVELRDKIKIFVPKDCVVGRLLHNFADYTIIESKSFSIEQHNMFNWETEGRELKQANEFSVFSDTIAQTLKGGMLCLNSKELNRIYHIICTIIERCDIDSKDDINMAFIQKLIALLIEDDKLFSPDLIENIIKSLGKGFWLYLKQ